MRKIPFLFIVACTLFSSLSTFSQNDSTRLDLGGIVLKRAFTQHVSIKGEDLEKMPFTNLSDAINVWLSGSYTNIFNLIYVVDGNIISDVNTYSVHDIEEVVLVQHSAALTGTNTQQQMVLITTRRGKEKLSIRGATQTFLVHSPDKTTDVSYQNTLGVDGRVGNIGYGLSASYIRDVMPSSKGGALHDGTPLNISRWRLNGYFTWRPNAANTIEAHMGFMPQTIDSAQNIKGAINGTPYIYDISRHQHDNLVTPWVRWHGEWFRGLKNDLQVGYLSELQKGKGGSILVQDSSGSENLLNAYFHTDHLYVRDRVSYQLQAGAWSLEPSFNASYEHFRDTYNETSETYSFVQSGGGGSLGGPVTGSTSNSQTFALNANIYVLTPMVDISYKHALDIQGGVVANVSHAAADQKGVKRVFPFAGFTVDLLGIGKEMPHNSLKIFGSYAQRDVFTFTDYYPSDLTGAPLIFSGGSMLSGTSFGNVSGTGTGIGPIAISSGNPVKNYWVWQTGATFTTRDDRWKLSYNFERRNFVTLGVYNIPTTGNYYYEYSEWKSSQHFLGLWGKIIEGPVFSWQSGLTATILQDKTNSYPVGYFDGIQGDYAASNNHPSWTGGWTNRVSYKRLSAGVDMLYHFNREVFPVVPIGPLTNSRANTFILQNVYIGYKLHMPGRIGLEVYVDSRGPARSDKSQILDTRRYYGVGGKITI